MRLALAAVALASGVMVAIQAPVAQELRDFNPTQGVGGYRGNVEALSGPVRLMWRERSGIIGTVETLGVSSHGAEERILTVFSGSVRELRDGLARRFAVSELVIGDRRVSSQEPLVIVESRSDHRGGNVSDIKMSFPGLISQGSQEPAEGSPQYRLWQDLFAADLAYSSQAVGIGDSIFDQGSYHALLEEQVRGILGDDSAQIIENTYATVARGQTIVNGRSQLLAELSGSLVAVSGSNRVEMEGQGYGLIDLASGLPTGTSRTTVVARQGGRTNVRTIYVDVRTLQ